MRRHYETFTIYCHIYCFTGWTGIVRASAEWFGLRNLIILSVGVLESELLFALYDSSGYMFVSFFSKNVLFRILMMPLIVIFIVTIASILIYTHIPSSTF